MNRRKFLITKARKNIISKLKKTVGVKWFDTSCTSFFEITSIRGYQLYDHETNSFVGVPIRLNKTNMPL